MLMEEERIVFEPIALALTNMNVRADEENFYFFMTSGNQVRRYQCSPKHAKRISLLLQKVIADYEHHLGELQTELPQAKNSGDGSIGFQVSRDSETGLDEA